jgi:hypothetical protein
MLSRFLTLTECGTSRSRSAPLISLTISSTKTGLSVGLHGDVSLVWALEKRHDGTRTGSCDEFIEVKDGDGIRVVTFAFDADGHHASLVVGAVVPRDTSESDEPEAPAA